MQSLKTRSLTASRTSGTKLATTRPVQHPQQRRKLCPFMAANGSSVRTKPSSGLKRPGQELDRNTGTATSSQGAAMESLEDGVRPVPLKYVVQEAVKRWFEDTMQEAQRGDVKQQALLGQMYTEGYGVQKDVKAAKEWTDKSAAKGYRMQGVYDKSDM